MTSPVTAEASLTSDLPREMSASGLLPQYAFFIYKIQVVNMRTLSLRLINCSRQRYLHGRTKRELHVASAICSGITLMGCNIEAARLETVRRFPPFSATAHETWRRASEQGKNSSLVAFRAQWSLNRCHNNAEHFSSLGRIGLLFGNNTGAEPERRRLPSQLCRAAPPPPALPQAAGAASSHCAINKKTIHFPSDCSEKTSNPKLTTG